MPGFIGLPGLIILSVLLLLIFGPKRLPEMGRSMGRGMKEFKDSVTGSDDTPELPAAREDERDRADRADRADRTDQAERARLAHERHAA